MMRDCVELRCERFTKMWHAIPDIIEAYLFSHLSTNVYGHNPGSGLLKFAYFYGFKYKYSYIISNFTVIKMYVM